MNEKKLIKTLKIRLEKNCFNMFSIFLTYHITRENTCDT